MQEILTREEAAEYIRNKGLKHVNAQNLAKMAWSGKGPPFASVNRRAYYKPADIDAWIAVVTKPVTKGRSAPATAGDDI